MIITRTVTVDRPVGVVFDYVSDFTTTTQWDPEPGRTELTYRAEFTFKGVWRLVAPLLAPAFRRLGDQAEAGLGRALSALPTR